MQANDFAKEFDDYGKEKIEFAELAKIWEDNKYEVRVSRSNVCSSQIFAPEWHILLESKNVKLILSHH